MSKTPGIDEIKEGKHILSLHASEGYFSANIICLAEEDDKCRLTCEKDCEVWPCFDWSEPNEGEVHTAHTLTDAGECQAVLFIENSDEIWDSVKGEFALSNGMELVLSWEGDYYSWESA